MGNWNINIQGIGCHHNGKPEIDADLATAEFVHKLRQQGHKIESATFTYGGVINYLESPSLIALAQCAYAAYGQSTDFKNFRGEPMPKFGELPDAIREAWIAAAQTTQGLVKGDFSVENVLTHCVPSTTSGPVDPPRSSTREAA